MRIAIAVTTFVAFFSAAAQAVPAKVVNPSLVAAQGDVKVNGAPAGNVFPQAIRPPAAIATGEKSAAMLAPVPGQLIYLGAATEIKALKAQLSANAQGVQTRSSSCQLVKGHVHSSIRHPKEGQSNQTVEIPEGKLSAKGTGWSTWVENGLSSMAFYAGSVSLSFQGADILIEPGQVGYVTGEGDAAVLELIDLKTGHYTRYEKGGATTSGLATASRLSEARNTFDRGLGAFIGTASDNEKIALSLLMEQINEILAKNNLPPITPPLQLQLFPDWFNEQYTRPASLASPDQPPPPAN